MKSNDEHIESILKKVDNYKLHQKRRNRVILSSICGLLLVFGISFVGLKNNIDFGVNNNLPTFESEEQLLAMLNANKESVQYKGYLFDGIQFAVSETADSAKADLSTNYASSDRSFSETNTQVQGVDESDIVKTNGDFIYYLSDNYLRVFETKTEDIKLVKEINLNEKKYTYGSELYINDEYIVVIASGRMEKEEPVAELKSKVLADVDYTRYSKISTQVFIYDINTYELAREIEIDGRYISSRKVDNNFYIITNKYINTHGELTRDDVMPLYKDSAANGNEYCEIAVTDIRYFPDFDKNDCSYMLISSFNLDKIDNEVDIYTCLGAGSEIYASRKNLYVTRTNYENGEYTTSIHKFEIKKGKVGYKSSGSVPGKLLNQFSMDEYDGYFRITTTKGNTWDNTSENNLYVLDDDLNIVGTLEGLAKGEKIYSTRFMGDKCYIVTYKTVDPLFVIDLSNPQNPIVLGELKIPGYSSYLHPIGENYLLGFGEDSVEKSYLNWQGETQVTAYANGLKMAIFDVSDYNNPKELYSIKMGARGSYSELLYNHKSLLFDEEKGIIAFPATLTEDAGNYDSGIPRYGKTIFNGALIYNISVENGISLRGKIEHELNGKKYNDNIQRILYIGDRLYTLSSNLIKVSDLETIKELDKLEINN